LSNIKSITSIGKHQTYDLEVEHPDHQFYLSNGVLTSNSHAVAYAFDSYYAAWLHTYYEKEWLCTILQKESSNPDGLSKTIREIKSYGFDFVNADINYSGDEWEFSEEIGAFVPPLGAVKGIGSGAMSEIIANRPYKSVEDLLFDETGEWRHSKVNKTCFTALCKIEALGSLLELREGKIENHRQLLLILTDEKNYDILKRGQFGLTKTALKKKIQSGESARKILDVLIEETEGTPDWTRGEKIENFVDLTSTSPGELIFPGEIMELIARKGIRPALDLNPGESNIGWFCVSSAEEKKTKKGTTYVKLNIMDNANRNGNVKIWGKLNASKIEPYTLWIAELKRDDWGLSGQSWNLKLIDSPN
jgi:DNA polymerase III alpha subunit